MEIKRREEKEPGDLFRGGLLRQDMARNEETHIRTVIKKR